MQLVFSTATVPRAEAYDCWMDVCATTLHTRSETPDRENFYAELQSGTVGDLRLTSWRSAPIVTHGSSYDALLLLLPASRGHAEFGERCFEVNRNCLYLVDRRHSSVSYPLEPVERTSVWIPRTALDQHLIERVANRPLALTGDAALLVGFVREIVRIGPSKLSPTAAELVRQQILDLTAAVLSRPPTLTPARQRHLGIPEAPELTPSGADRLEMHWLALRILLARDVDGIRDQFKKTLLLDGPQAPEAEH